MKTKKIYLVRHGQTEFNRQGIVQGSGIDAPLNELGRKQADSFYDAYSHLDFGKVYTSDLIRTHQSVSKFINDGIAHVALPGLNEIDWGEKEGHKVDFGNDDYFNMVVREWRQGNTGLKIIGGESPEDVAARQQLALDRILSDPEELVLISMHGRAIRIILCVMLGQPLHQMDEYPHDNLGLYKLEYENSTVNLLETNNTEHVKHLIIE